MLAIVFLFKFLLGTPTVWCDCIIDVVAELSSLKLDCFNIILTFSADIPIGLNLNKGFILYYFASLVCNFFHLGWLLLF